MSDRAYAFSTQYNGLASQLINEVYVSDTLKTLRIPLKSAYKCNGLWDTGATNTVISSKIIDELKLPIVSKTPIQSVNGRSETTMHVIDLWLPNHMVIRKVRALRGDLPSEIGVLIGMDIIVRGDFSISNYGCKTLFSYRSPSSSPMNYVEQVEAKSGGLQ